ncbi:MULTISPECIES: hypothetical protein [Rhizobium/Agrobacterium group]|uniref:hypothetical protein n=1 Tax=Rhizobium/Agrobacterium group TaxID=227290 RepID=UPI00110E8B88|nr:MULTISPECIES: hypothetical protein [Rhizobium/Agrobacterium group]NWJ24552.1 hypothetical protein [Rhizobium sp. RM]TMV16361.1 hypothetical protein BJG94_18100 [Rhizobium sp. Td3]UXS02884.1 hypothetical protein FY156_16105 [Agrobacterium tumefaciens]
MTFDPGNPRPERDLRPEVNITNEPRARSSWTPWLAVIVVVLVGIFAWSQMSGPTTDPSTTSSTTPPAVSDQAPAPAPMTPTTPATPPANNAAPTTPGTGGTQTQP